MNLAQLKASIAIAPLLLVGALCTASAQAQTGTIPFNPAAAQQPYPDFMGAVREGQEVARERQAQREHAAEVQQRAARLELGRQVGVLVAAGKCIEARTLALQNGDFEIAGLAEKYCSPGATAPK